MEKICSCAPRTTLELSVVCHICSVQRHIGPTRLPSGRAAAMEYSVHNCQGACTGLQQRNMSPYARVPVFM